MTHRFAELTFTPAVKAVQARLGSRGGYERLERPEAPANDRFGDAERAFIAARDSVYMASVTETGWPYLQHRGGPPGFLKVLDERTLGLADYRGNRQYVSVGNLGQDDRIALFLMDYPNRRRLKILGRARLIDAASEPETMRRLDDPGYGARVERGMLIALEGFDWNCPQHITPRFTEAEVAQAVAPLVQRLREAEVASAHLPSIRGDEMTAADATSAPATGPTEVGPATGPTSVRPPFTAETAARKARMAEDAWNTRDPERVALAYTQESVWRNRDEFLTGRPEIVAFLQRKWAKELDYRLVKEVWAFTGDRIAARFAYEWRDDGGRWFRSHGNEQWEFDGTGMMRRREASINDVPIDEGERKFRWPAGPRPADHPGLSELGL